MPRSSRPPPPHGPHHHGPRHHGSRHVPPPRRSSPGRAVHLGGDAIADLIAPWIAEEEDRAFVSRCIAAEGPAHHRLASVALLRLLAGALSAAGAEGPFPAGEGPRVPFRLPPHLERAEDEDAHYPIHLPLRAIQRIAGDDPREVEAFADALTDGPPHHALANVLMVTMLDALIDHLAAKDKA